MKLLFLGDIVGNTGSSAIKNYLGEIVKNNSVDFVIANGENSHETGIGISENLTKEFLSCGIDVITTGNHVWDQKEIFDYINCEKRLLRPINLTGNLPGNGFGIYKSKKGFKIGVLNLMGNVFMKKSENVFNFSKKFLLDFKLKRNFDFLVVDFHGETTSEKMAIGHFFDGKATLVIGTHTHVPTNDARVLANGTAYQTDAGMCGDYDSVIGMNKQNSINKFLKISSDNHYPSENNASICGVIVDADIDTGLANNIKSFIFGGILKNN
tara:strand:+ start:157 stop:960 length:804 start_codon:yes stop_codon:yes gene_type:complete